MSDGSGCDGGGHDCGGDSAWVTADSGSCADSGYFVSAAYRPLELCHNGAPVTLASHEFVMAASVTAVSAGHSLPAKRIA